MSPTGHDACLEGCPDHSSASRTPAAAYEPRERPDRAQRLAGQSVTMCVGARLGSGAAAGDIDETLLHGRIQHALARSCGFDRTAYVLASGVLGEKNDSNRLPTCSGPAAIKIHHGPRHGRPRRGQDVIATAPLGGQRPDGEHRCATGHFH